MSASRYEMSANAAAAEIRHKILRKIRQLEKDGLTSTGLPLLRDFIKGMAKRGSKKPGGLGRK